MVAFKHSRDDVGMLLIKDVMNDYIILRDDYNYVIVLLSIEGGCPQSFKALITMFPDDDDQQIGYCYIDACCYGLKDAADEIFRNYFVDEEDIEFGQSILQYLDDGIITTELTEKIKKLEVILQMIKSGYTLRAYTLLNAVNIKQFELLSVYLMKNKLRNSKGMSKDDIKKAELEVLEEELIDAICIGLNIGTITKFGQMKLYIKKGHITADKLLHSVVTVPKHDLRIIRSLTKLIPKDERIKIITHALSYGNWEYADVMTNV